MNILSVRNVTITYHNSPAIKDVNFDVAEEDYFCILGSNGSGKSTLVKGILGLIPINEGEIHFGVHKGQISYLPQINSIPRDMPATVKEIVLTGTQKSGNKLPFYNKEDVLSACIAMERLKIMDIAKKRVGELSGGQQQRVLLARALCKNPKILILDEPCSGLDENIAESLYEILSDINTNNKVTIIMISHDLTEIKEYATKIIVLDQRVTFYGNIVDWLEYRDRGAEK